MPLYKSKHLHNAYIWMISSVYRIIAGVLLFTILLLLISLYINPLISILAASLMLFVIFITAFSIRHTGAALDYPGVDRFFQRVPCYLSIQDKDLRIIRANKLFRKDFGNRIGEYCYKVYKQSNTPCPDCPVLKTFADGLTHKTEEAMITKDGKPGQMIVYTTPVPDEQGSVVGVMEMSTNITEIKELQIIIEASRKKFMNLFDTVPCYISVQDEDFRITESNALFKKEFSEQIGDYCYKVYKGLDDVCPDCPVQKTFIDGKVYSREETVIRRNGSEARMIVYSSAILNEAGDRVAVMEMSTDITEVKKLQKELTLLGRTIAVMAHRIKNILMGLEGGIFVVNTGMEDNDDKLTRKGWGMIEHNFERVSRIVKDLLYCSREREMSFEIVDPVPTIRSVYELFRDRIQKEGVELVLDLPESLPVGRFDPEALHSLITNLVANALDACKNDSTEGKDSHKITIRGNYDSSGKYIFEVEDNGTGIPGQIGERLFEDFFTTKGREGTGLGLLVANKIIEVHGGSITFQSSPGKGTIFRSVFPGRIAPCCQPAAVDSTV
ncbi:MAG: ATP-binding protein [Candidatus Hatepunaea meridiana]|nr:ATP-binding protein [Candidatus Hatepunaea meridiana]